MGVLKDLKMIDRPKMIGRFLCLFSAIILCVTPSAFSATSTWDGDSIVDSNWDTPENWVGDGLPAAGDALTFNAATSGQYSNINTFPDRTTFGTITLTGYFYTIYYNFDISGNDVRLTNGMVNNGEGTNTFRPNITIRTLQNFDVSLNTGLLLKGVIRGAGGINKTGGGILDLQRGNSYTGPTQIQEGTLRAIAAAIRSAVVTNNGYLALNHDDTVTFDKTVTGTGHLVKEGVGTVTVTGAQSYGGGTYITGGTLKLGGDNVLPATTDVHLDFAYGEAALTLDLNNYNQTVDYVSGASYSNINLGTGRLTVNSFSFNGDITGTTGGITINGSGGNFSGVHSYSGDTLINSGTISVGNFSDQSAIVIASGAMVNSAASDRVGSIEGSGSLSLNGTPYYVGGNDKSTTFSGEILQYGDNNLVKEGTGTMTLTGSVSVSTITASGGTIAITGNDVIANDYCDLVINKGARLDFNNANDTIDALQGTGTLGINNTTLSVGYNGYNNPVSTFSGVIEGNGNLVKIGGGTLSLEGNNTYTGTTTISAGILRLTPTSLQQRDITDNGFLAINLVHDPYTYTGAVTGAGGLNKEGSGTLTISGATSFTGATNINAGTLKLGAAERLSDTGILMIATGAVFDLNGFNETVGELSLSGTGSTGNINLGAGTLTTGGTNQDASWYYGNMKGSGGLTKIGTGTLELAGNNTYMGATNIQGGTLRANWSNAIPDSSAVTVAAGATLNLTTYNDTIGSIAGAGNIDLGSATLTAGANNASTAYSGVMSGGSFAKAGTGTLTLSGLNTYTGTTGISRGTLLYGADNVLGDSTAIVIGKGVLDLAGRTDTVKSIAGGGAVILGAGALTLNTNNTNATYSGVISGTGTLTKTGAGIQTLDGTSTYSGATAITGGTLVMSGATLGQRNNITNDSYLGITQSSGTHTYNSSIAGSGALIKEGAGTVVFNAAQGYAGGTAVRGGTLKLGASDILSDTGTITFANNGTLDLNNFNETVGNLDSGNGIITLGTGRLTFGGNDAATTYSGTISGTGGITKVGMGKTAMYGMQTYSGDTIVSAGILERRDQYSTSPNSAYTIASGAVLAIENFFNIDAAIGSLEGAGDVTAASTRLLAGRNNRSTTFSGVMSGTGTFVKEGTGAMTMTGANTYTGATEVNGGTLALSGASGALSGTSTVTLSSGTLALDSSAGNHLDGNRLDDAAQINVTNGGTLLLKGAPGAATTETVGEIRPNGGLSRVVVTKGSGGTAVLNSASFNYFGGLMNFISTDLGNTEKIMFNTIPSQTNGILDYGAGIVNGADMAKYDAANGIMALAPADYVTSLASADSTSNVKLSATETLLTPTAINSLVLNNGTVNGESTLTVDRGVIVATGTSAINAPLAFVEAPRLYTDGSLSLGGTVTGGFEKMGTGTVTVNGNVAGGSVTIDNGTVALGTSDKLDDNYNVTVNKGTFDIGANSDTVWAVTLNDGAISGSGGILTATGFTVKNGTVSASLGGVGIALTKSDTGTVTLSGANTYTGATSINEGTLVLGASNVIADTSPLSVTGVLDIGANTESVAAVTSSGQIIGAGTLTGTSFALYGGTVSARIAGGDVVVDGTTTLSGTNSYTGTTTIISGSLIGNLDNIKGDITVNAGGTLYLNNDSNETLSNTLTGTGVLTKAGAGILDMSGANTHSGITNINAGTIRTANAASGLGVSSAVNVASGAQFNLNSFTGTIGSLAGAGEVVLGSATLTVGGDDGLTNFSGIMSGTGNFVKAGNATMTLSGANTYGGTTTVSGGTLKVNADSLAQRSVSNTATLQLDVEDLDIPHSYGGAITGTGTTIVNTGILKLSAADRLSDTGVTKVIAGATLDLNNFNETVGNIDTSGALGIGSGNLTLGENNLDGYVGGTVTGSGNLIKTGTGMVLLDGLDGTDNKYTGNIVVNGGTIQMKSIDLPSSTLDVGAGAKVFLWNIVGNPSGTVKVAALTGSGEIEFNNTYYPVLTTGLDNSSSTFSGTMTGGPSDGYITKAGTGTTTLSGSVDINTVKSEDGAINLGASNVMADTVNLLVDTYGTFDLNGFSDTVAMLTGDGLVQLTSGTLGIGANDNTSIFTGTITGNGSIEKVGAGAVSLIGNNQYTGSTTISGGTLIGAALNFGSQITNNATMIFNQPENGQYTSSIGGTGTVIKQEAGTLTFNQQHTYTGPTQVAAGTIRYGAHNVFDDSSALTLTGGVVDIGAFSDTVGTLTLTEGVITGTTGILSPANTELISGTISAILGGSGTIQKTGAGTVTLLGNNQYSADITVAGGTLSGTTSSLKNNIANSGTLEFDQQFDGTYSGSLSNSGSVNKRGSGSLRLTGDSSAYTGSMTVYEGGLDIGGPNSAAVTVGTGAVLSGSGTIGELTLEADGILSPGNSPGTMSVSGNMTWGPGIYEWEINDFAGTQGADPGWDWINVGGTLNITMTADDRMWIDIKSLLLSGVEGAAANFDAKQNYTRTIATASLGVSGFDANNFLVDTTNFMNNLEGGYFGIALSGDSKDLLLQFTSGPRERVWDAGGGVNTNWTTAVNWSNDAAPNALDDVRFGTGGSAAVVNTAQTVGLVTFSRGFDFAVSGGFALTVRDGIVKEDAANYTVSCPVELGGAQAWSNDVAGGKLTVSGAVATAGFGLTVDGIGTTEISGAISGAGGLTKNDVGTLTLSGANDYAGGTTVSGGTLIGTTTSLQGNITDDAILVFDQTAAGTYAGVVIGTGALVKSGTGAVTVSGANTYSGGTTVSGGTLIGTTTSLQGNITDNAALAFDQAEDGTYAGVVIGTGALVKSGTGAVTVIGANTYSGGTTVSGGTLIGTTTSLQGSITDNARVAFDQGTDGAYAGVISGSGGVNKSGTGTVTLSGVNTYNGTTTISAGTLAVTGSIANSASTIESGATLGGSGTTGAVTINSNGTISPGMSPGTLNTGSQIWNIGSRYLWEINDVNGDYPDGLPLEGGAGSDPGWDFLNINGSLTLSTDPGQFTIDITSLGLDNLAGPVNDFDTAQSYSWTIARTTAGIQNFDGLKFTYTYTNFMNLFDGNFGIGTSGDGKDLILQFTTGVEPPDTWDAGGAADTNWSTSANWTDDTIPANGANLSFGTGGSVATVDSARTAGLVTFNRGADFTVDGALALTINGGIVKTDAANYTVAAPIALGAAQAWSNNDALGALTISGDVANGGYALTVNGIGDTTVSGAISGAGGLTKDDASTLTLTGANSYTGGTTVNAGTLKGTTSGLQGSIANSSVLVFDQAIAGTYAGVVSGTGSLVKTGSGTVMLSGANTYSGGTTVSGGTLAGTTDSLQGNITDNARVAFDQGTDGTYAGVISGSGGLNKSGAGIVTLSGVNTYNGTTTISAGKLAVNGSIANSASTIESGATLGGSGTTGAVTINNNGTISPGMSPGTLNTGAQIWNIGSRYLWEINDVNGDYPAGGAVEGGEGLSPGWDLLNINGMLTLSTDPGQFIVDITSLTTGNVAGLVNDFNNAQNYSWTIAKTTAGIQNFDALKFTLNYVSFLNDLGGGSFGIGTANGGLDLVLQYATAPLPIWDAGGAADTTWSNAANWDGNVVPASGADVSFGTGGTVATVDSARTAGLVTFNRGADFTVDGASALTINGGIVKTDSGNYTISAPIALGAAQTWSNNDALGALTISGDVANGGYALTVNGIGDTTVSGAISGAGGLTKDDASTLTLTGANSYTGGTTVNAGTLKGTTSGLQGNIANSSVLVFDQGVAGTYAGVVSGTGSLVKTGSGTVMLSGANTYSGGTTVSVGTLAGTTTSLQGNISNNARVAFDQATDGTYAGVIGGTGGLNKSGAGIVTLSGVNTYNGTTTISAGKLAVNGSIANSASTIESGAALSGSGTTGAVTINNNGTISPGMSPGTLNTGAQIWNIGSRYLWEINDVNGDYPAGGAVEGGEGLSPGWDLLNINGTLTLSIDPGQFFIDITSLTTGNVAGLVNDFNNAQNYLWTIARTTSGIQNFDSGKFSLSYTNFMNDRAGGIFGITQSGDGKELILQFTSAVEPPDRWDGGGGAGDMNWSTQANWTNDTVPSAGANVSFGTGGVTAIVDGASSVGTVTFNRGADFIVSGGIPTLTINGGIVKTDAANYTVAAPVVLGAAQTWSNDAAGGALTVSGTVNNGGFALTVDGVGATTISGMITGGGSLTKNEAGTLTLSSANSYTGGTTINGGTLIATTASIPGNVTNNANLKFDQPTDGTYAGVISGTGALTKSGSTTVTLSGVNTYSGATTVAAGKLAVNGSISNSATTVQSGATLGGSGAVGIVTVEGGGILSPGNSVGIMTSKNQIWNPAGRYRWEIVDSDLGAGSGWDWLNIAGSLTVNATQASRYVIDLVSLVGPAPGPVADFNNASNYSWKIASATGGITGFDALKFDLNGIGFANQLNGGTFSIAKSADSKDLLLKYTPLPPPTERIWDGGSTVDNDWQTGENWTGDTAPNQNDRLTFAGSTRLTPSNDFLSNATFGEIKFTAGGFTIGGSPVTLTGGINNVAGANTLNPQVGITLANSQAITNSGTSLTIGGDIQTNGWTLTLGGTGPTTVSGAIIGAGGVTKSGIATLTMTGANTYMGVTTMGYNGGTTVLTGAVGALQNTPSVSLDFKSVLKLDNAAVNNNDRINNAANVSLGKHAELMLIGANTEEVIGNLMLTGAASVVTVSNGLNQYAVLRAASLVKQSADGSVNFVGTGLGTAGNNPRVMLDDDAVSVLDATGIIPFATVNNNKLATYDLLTGIKAYTPNVFNVKGGNFAQNVLVTDVQAPLDPSTTTTINSLTVDGGTVGGGIDSVLTIGSGTVLTSGDSTISVPTLDFGTTGGLIITNGTTTVDSVITGSGGLTTAGTGTITLNGTNAYTGTTTVGAGTLSLRGRIGDTVVQSGVIKGSGYLEKLSGSGTVSPGNSPGIMTVTQVDPSEGLDWAFEFTSVGSPYYVDPLASVNDVMRITDPSVPFLSALTDGNVIDVFFNVAAINYDDIFKGGFYTDMGSDFLNFISDATYNYYLRDPEGNGAFTHETITYNALDSAYLVSVSALAESADFGVGQVEGYVTQFMIQQQSGGEVPEPSTLLLLLLPLLGFGLRRIRK